MEESKLERMIPSICLALILGIATAVFYSEAKTKYGSLQKTYENFIEQVVDKYPSRMFNP